MILYHGSNDGDLTDLEGNNPGYSGSLGYGLYLTSSPEFAAIFGEYIYPVESPVPDDLVAQIEPNVFECSGPITVYTHNSMPFIFDLAPQAGGDPVRYAVLGDCEDEVKTQLRAAILTDIAVNAPPVWNLGSDDTAAANAAFPAFFRAVLEGEGDWHAIERGMDAADDAGMFDGNADADAVYHALEELFAAWDAIGDEAVEATLGIELDLDDLSNQVRHAGYSAFHIDGYADGDEYVIVDNDYLPVPILDVAQPQFRRP